MPTWNRAAILPNTLNSILNQTLKDFELIIIDDGSTDNTWDILQSYAGKDNRIRLFRHEKSRERVISWNEGMREAKGDWLYFVDSDDEIAYGSLEILNHNIEQYPEYKVFNFGQIIYSLTGADLKLARELPDWDREGMDHFDTGLVGAGGFTFKRECLDHIGWMPEADNVYDLADWFGKEVKKWFEENKPGEDYPRYNKDDRWVGNPWGQDFALMWLVTRKYKSKKLPLYLYIAYIRTEPWLYERADNSGVMG